MKGYVCSLCPRQCGALRYEEDGEGICGAGTLPRVARIAPHYWEEPCISGERGSGTVFFSGCTLSCVFCQNYEISAKRRGKLLTVEELSDRIKELEDRGVHNINLVSPTPYVESIIRCFELFRPKVPIVWNTSGYERVETLRRLEGLVDIYLPDLKYTDPALSGRLSGAADYFDYALPAIKEMVRQTGSPVFDDSGIMLRGTIVRHLILPGHTKNSVSVLDCIKREFGTSVLVSLMGQYLPLGRAGEFADINRRITKREYEKVCSHLEALELEGFAQELSSAKESYVPDWDL